MIDASAEVAGDGAVGYSDHQADRARHQADSQRYSRSLERACEQIAPEPVRSEPMRILQRRFGGHMQPIQGLRAVRIEPRTEQCQRDDAEDDDDRAHRSGIGP
jgi:hypothetical protein